MRVVPTYKLASALGVTPQRIYQLRRDGIIGALVDLDGRRVRNAHSLWDSVRDFADYKSKSRHAGRPSVGEREEDIQSVFSF
jgi:hypothetical protein